MTVANQVEHLNKDLICDNTPEHHKKQQWEQQLFYIILVDIKEASAGRIHCVEMPLPEDDDDNDGYKEEEDLKYVAISYRWGELQEQLVDTGLGYLASITSFILHDFYHLCTMMRREKDLRHMNYVWVDAICVNQSNYEQRKATIHQMSNIYKRANYILAVPDLHAAYLKDTVTKNKDIMHGTCVYNKDIYHLIHGNTDELAALEDQLFNEYNIPMETRQWLTTYTDHFTDGFMKRRWHHFFYNPEEALDHIYKVSQTVSSPSPPLPGDIHHCCHSKTFIETTNSSGNKDTDAGVHHCNDVACPLYFFNGQIPQWRMDMLAADKYKHHFQWKESIQKRSTSIRQSIHFLGDLIVDWSSRVWVISEYSIAKKRNNLKYWFTQLGTPNVGSSSVSPPSLSFFSIDFNDNMKDGSNPTSSSLQIITENVMAPPFIPVPSDPVYLTFHQTVVQQLKNQTFLEMILKSKASKAEDRFYAALPLFDHYKDKIMRSQTSVNSRCWDNMTTMLDVKLTLFEWMNISDKLNLLFLTGNVTAPTNLMILPTFATTTLSWVSNAPRHYLHLPHIKGEDDEGDRVLFNFDLTDPSTIMLRTTTTACHSNNNNNIPTSRLHFLHLKPREYYVNVEPTHTNTLQNNTKKTLCKQLQLDPFVDPIAVVRISSFCDAAMKKDEHGVDWKRYCIFLTGNFEKNKWVLSSVAFPQGLVDAHWQHHTYSKDHPSKEGFHIY